MGSHPIFCSQCTFSGCLRSPFILHFSSLFYFIRNKMASFKRSAGSDFERCASTKVSTCPATLFNDADLLFQKACVAPPTDFDPDQGIAIRVKPSPTPRSHAMLTRRITTRQSTAAVLDTYELLEAILHELPMEKILEVRQVSKSWDSLVKNSKPLRTKLFLEAEPRTCLWSLDRATLKLRPYEWGSREKMGEAWMQTQFLSRPSIANPLLFSHDPILRSPLAIRALTCEGLHFTASPDLAKKRSIVHEVCYYRNLCPPPWR